MSNLNQSCSTSYSTLKSLLLILSLSLASATQGADVKSTNIKGYDFSVRDVQNFCKAKRASGDNLSIHCKEKRLKPVTLSCEGWITGGLDAARLSCGGGLWVLNSQCKIEMRGASNGEVNCVF